MAVLELLARATEAWVVAAGNEHLVNRSSRTVDGVSRRCTAGRPVRTDVAGGWRYQFPRTPDVSHRHPGKPRLIPSACSSRFRCRRDGWPRTSRDALRRAVANPKGRVRCP